MTCKIWTPLIIAALVTGGFCANLKKIAECTFVPIDGERSKAILQSTDSFLENLSPFDRSSRSKTSQTVDPAQFKEFIGSQTLDWNNEEKVKLQTLATQLKEKLKAYNMQFPQELQFIKTTGSEEGNAAYCRGNNAIVLPQRILALPTSELEDLVLHELFHIFTRNHSAVQTSLYATIGFYPCKELQVPSDLFAQKITNPDAVQNNYFFKTSIRDTEYKVMPILLARSNYDENQGGEFFDYLTLQFIAIDASAQTTVPLLANGKVQLFTLAKIPNYLDAVGQNTGYIIHPEEILADNFVLLVNHAQNVESPQVLSAMAKILQAP